MVIAQTPTEHMEAGKAFVMERAYQKALDEYEAAHQKYYKAGKYEEAFKALESKSSSYMFLSQTDSMMRNSLRGIAIIDKHHVFEEKRKDVNASIAELLYIKEDFRESISYYKKILIPYKEAGDDKGYASILMQIGDCFRILVEKDSAEYYFNQAEPLMEASGDSASISKIYIKKSVFHSTQYEYEKALDYSIRSIKLLDDKKHTYFKTGAYQNIATVFRKMKNNTQAIHYMKKGIELAESKNYQQILATIRSSYAEVLLAENKVEEALSQIALAKDIFSKTNKKKRLSGILYTEAKILLTQGRKAEAKKVLNTSLATYDFPERTHQISNLLASLAIDEGNFKASKELLLNQLEVGEEKKLLVELNRSYELLAKSEEGLGQFKKANQYLKKRDQLKDSLYNIGTNEIAQTMVAEFQFDQQEKEIQLLNTQNEVKALEIESAKKQRLVSYAIIGGLGLSSLLLYFFFSSKRKSNQLLQEKNQVITKALNDKDTLLREIHHRVKNNLQVIGSLLRLQSNYTDDENVLQAINEGQSRVRSMAIIHQKLYQKENLTGVGTKEYLEQLIKELFATYKVDLNKIHLELDIDNIDLDVDTVIPIGLVANELISNALKYAFTNKEQGKLKVSLKEVKKQLVLKVEDDGVGISNLNVVEQPTSFGWNLINIFKDKLDGNIEVDTSEGTSIKIAFNDYNIAV